MTRTICLLSMLAVLGGCSELDNCPDESAEVVPITTGTTHREALMYQSAPWAGPRDAFPAKTLMRFNHDLMVTPEIVDSYVSFESGNSAVSENAGNQGLIRCVDDTDIWIKNDTCEESFYILVAALASGATNTACSCQDQFDNNCPDP